MSVNLSARQLREPGLAGAVAEALVASGTEPEDLILEITESVLVEDFRSAVPALRVLRASGVRIAIDDFGTGYSNLSYLKRLPVDHLKLDRSIVSGIDRDRTDLALAASALALARALSLGVVAGGVETRGEAEKFAEVGCDLGQGFYWRRPAPPEESWLLVAHPRPAPEGD
jgi:Amt family ammonium transporter